MYKISQDYGNQPQLVRSHLLEVPIKEIGNTLEEFGTPSLWSKQVKTPKW